MSNEDRSCWEPHAVCGPFTLENMFINSEMNHCSIYAKSTIQGYIVIFHCHSRLSLLFTFESQPALLLNRKPGLLPDLPNLIMVSSEDTSDWGTLPWGPTSALVRALPVCSNWCVMEISAVLSHQWINRSPSAKCPERTWGKTESLPSSILFCPLTMHKKFVYVDFYSALKKHLSFVIQKCWSG